MKPGEYSKLKYDRLTELIEKAEKYMRYNSERDVLIELTDYTPTFSDLARKVIKLKRLKKLYALNMKEYSDYNIV